MTTPRWGSRIIDPWVYKHAYLNPRTHTYIYTSFIQTCFSEGVTTSLVLFGQIWRWSPCKEARQSKPRQPIPSRMFVIQYIFPYQRAKQIGKRQDKPILITYVCLMGKKHPFTSRMCIATPDYTGEKVHIIHRNLSTSTVQVAEDPRDLPFTKIKGCMYITYLACLNWVNQS